jgi:hypothetical protein
MNQDVPGCELLDVLAVLAQVNPHYGRPVQACVVCLQDIDDVRKGRQMRERLQRHESALSATAGGRTISTTHWWQSWLQ